jgi:hypothetical protein
MLNTFSMAPWNHRAVILREKVGKYEANGKGKGKGQRNMNGNEKGKVHRKGN